MPGKKPVKSARIAEQDATEALGPMNDATAQIQVPPNELENVRPLESSMTQSATGTSSIATTLRTSEEFQSRSTDIELLQRELKEYEGDSVAYADCGRFQRDSTLVLETLYDTIIRSNTYLYPDRFCRQRLIYQCVQCLWSIDLILEILGLQSAPNPFRKLLDAVNKIREEEERGESYNVRLHLLEEFFAEDLFPECERQVKVVAGRLSMRVSLQDQNVKGVRADSVTIGKATFKVDRDNHVIRREGSEYAHTSADFGNVRDCDRWKVAVELILARGGEVDVEKLLQSVQSRGSIRQIVRRIREDFKKLDLDVPRVPSKSSHWRVDVRST